MQSYKYKFNIQHIVLKVINFEVQDLWYSYIGVSKKFYCFCFVVLRPEKMVSSQILTTLLNY